MVPPSVGTLGVSGEGKCPPSGLAWVLFGALAVRVELWAAESFKWAFQQRGRRVSPQLGAGTCPTTLCGRRGLSDRRRSRHALYAAYLSCH